MNYRMFGFFNHRIRVTQRLNTIDLGDDLDDVEMLEAVEEAFGICLDSAEVATLVTVGQLYDLINAKLTAKDEFDPVWALTCQIARAYSGSNDPIDHETTFFPKYAKERTDFQK